jgi:hypothetical protein
LGLFVGVVVGYFTGGIRFAIAEAIGFGSTAATVIGGAVGGALGGLTSAGINGGNLGQAALYGGLFGGFMGWAASGASGTTPFTSGAGSGSGSATPAEIATWAGGKGAAYAAQSVQSSGSHSILKFEFSLGPQFGFRAGPIKGLVNFGSMVQKADVDRSESVKQEFTLAIDFGRGFFGVSLSREVPGRIPNSASYWVLFKKLQKQDFTWKFARNPLEISDEGLKIGFGAAAFIGVNFEFDILEAFTAMFNDTVNSFAIKPAPGN